MSTKSPVAVSGKRVASRCPTLLESVPGRVNPEVRSGASWSAPMTPRAAAATQAAATVLGRRRHHVVREAMTSRKDSGRPGSYRARPV